MLVEALLEALLDSRALAAYGASSILAKLREPGLFPTRYDKSRRQREFEEADLGTKSC